MRSITSVTEELFDKHFNINVKGAFFTMQKALPLLKNGSSIILNASVVATKVSRNISVYAATKAAVRNMAKTWALELSKQKIRVNAVSPGPIETPIFNESGVLDEQVQATFEYFSRQVPLGRTGHPEEVAKTVAFLASNDASYINGTELFVDGSYILNGKKSWISLGSWAKYINVFTMTRDEQGNQLGLTGFLVEQDMKGWVPGKEALTFGMKGLPQNHIEMKNLHLQSNAVLGIAGGGKEAAEEAFMLGRSDIGANAVGTMKRCLQLISRYAKRRPIATGKLFDNGFTHQILTDCAAACRAAELFTMHIGWQLDKKEQVPDEIHIICKVVSSELLWKVVDRSVQMLGARGFLDTNIVGQLHRDSRLLRIFEGPTEAMFLFLGQGILKNEHSFLRMVSNQYGMSDVIGRMEDTFEYFRHRFGHETDKANHHTHCAAIGQIACWGVLAAVVRMYNEDLTSRFDNYVALWASRKLDQSISETRSEFRPKSELPSSDLLSSQIDSYADTIGVIEQTLPGEARDLDPWITLDFDEENILHN